MRAVMAVMATVMLSGCVSSVMESARSQQPTKALTSSKPAQQVAQCIQFAWQDEAVFGVDASGYLEPNKAGGFTVYTREAESFADVRALSAQTDVKYYAVRQDAVAQRRLAGLATCM